MQGRHGVDLEELLGPHPRVTAHMRAVAAATAPHYEQVRARCVGVRRLQKKTNELPILCVRWQVQRVPLEAHRVGISSTAACLKFL